MFNNQADLAQYLVRRFDQHASRRFGSIAQSVSRISINGESVYDRNSRG